MGRERGKTMRQIGTCQRAALHALAARRFQPRQISSAKRPAALDDACSDGGYGGMNGHVKSLPGTIIEILLQFKPPYRSALMLSYKPAFLKRQKPIQKHNGTSSYNLHQTNEI